MLRKLQIRQTPVVALLVLSMLGHGLQAYETTGNTGCRCAANSIESIGPESPNRAPSSCCTKSKVESDCCSTQLEPASRCCSTKLEPASSCCCNPNAQVCECDDCSCGDQDSPGQSLPAIPPNETHEVVSPTSICAASRLGLLRCCDFKRLSWPQGFSNHAAQSSKQTCVLLSRFTC